MKTVTFCGHSTLPLGATEAIRRVLTSELEKLILQGADTFLLGGYGEFDTLCALIVKELKTTYPHILSVFVTPYLNRPYNLHLYDTSEYPPIENVPLRYAISKRNEYMVIQSDIVVAYVTNHFGGAYKTLKYAQGKKKEILLINTMI